MDYQNRAGSKFGGGGVASFSATNADRRERLRKLALESIDLEKDPYWLRNHVGLVECRLCLTEHQNDNSYLVHTQGKRHQANLARRAARKVNDDESRRAETATGLTASGASAMQLAAAAARRKVIRIGRPGYKVIKVRDATTRQVGLFVHVDYPDISPGIKPEFLLINAFMQRVEDPDRRFQYLLIAAEPYETIAFKIPSREIDRSEDKHFDHWDPDLKVYNVQILFMTERQERFNAAPGLTGN